MFYQYNLYKAIPGSDCTYVRPGRGFFMPVPCYTESMDDYEGKTKGAGALPVFFLVLAAVLVIGGIFLLAARRTGGRIPESSASDDGQLTQAVIPEEPIPENVDAVSENGGAASSFTDADAAPAADPAGTNPSVPGLAEATPTASPNIVKLPDGTYYVQLPEDRETAELVFGGDILFDTNYATGASALQRGGAAASFDAGSLGILQSADICMLNNEFPYSTRGTPLPDKAYTFRASPDTARWLPEIGTDVVSLANNHMFDYGPDALEDTLTTLDDLGVIHTGAGRNFAEAAAPAVFRLGKMKVAVFNATQIERFTDAPDTRGATENTSGVFRCFTEEENARLLKGIRDAAQTADCIILYIHWGTESTNEPDYYQTCRLQEYADAGCSLIVGDHPHVLQGITRAGRMPVFYSLGNFLFTSRTTDTGVLSLTLRPADKTIETLQFIPMVQENSAVRMAAPEEKERILGNLRSWSPGVSIDADGYIAFQ